MASFRQIQIAFAPLAAIIDGRMTADWSPVWISLRVGGLGAAGSLALGLWLAWVLATREFRGVRALEAAAELPAVLPPLILGTYFAFALAGRPQDFTWRVAALAAVVSALPAMVRAARAAFEGLPRDYGNAARSLGASGWRVFWRVMAPLAYRPILAAASLAFARLAAEYAVTILVAAQAGARSALMAGPLLPSLGLAALAALAIASRLERRQARV
jgi:molybdate transport system permease protein